MPNQTDPNQVTDTTNTPPVSVPNTDLPPLPDFMNVPASTNSPEPQTAPADDSSGSTAPSDLPPVMATPKKKFGGGKIIATILGLVLLVGGIGAGVVLTQQQQLFQQKAAPLPECSGCSCGCNYDTSGHFSGCKSCTNQTTGDLSNVTTQTNQTTGDLSNVTTQTNQTAGDLSNVTTQTSQTTIGDLSNVNVSLRTCAENGGTCMVAGITGCSAPGKIHVDGTCSDSSKPSCCRDGGTGDNALCSQAGCGTSSCSVPSGLYPTCYVNHYWCQTRSPGGCSSNLIDRAVASASFSKDCGTEQIDIYCPTCGSTSGGTTGGNKYVSKTYNSDCGGGTTSAPMCTTIKAYDPSWSALTSAQLSALSAGAQVNFCVSGSAPSGTFDKAQFTIKGVQQPETTTVRPSSTDFCQSYTILSTDTTVGVTAKIHHSTLGWY